MTTKFMVNMKKGRIMPHFQRIKKELSFITHIHINHILLQVMLKFTSYMYVYIVALLQFS